MEKNVYDMNNHELLEFMIAQFRDYAEISLSTITTGNLAHRIACIKYGLLKCADLVERIMKKNDEQQSTIEPPSFEESMGETKAWKNM